MHHLRANYAKNTKIYHLTSTKMKTGKITGGLQYKPSGDTCMLQN